jgi:hypothetical protein
VTAILAALLVCAGSGGAARRLGRRYVGLELNAEYAAMSRRRISEDQPMLNRQPEPDEARAEQASFEMEVGA